MTATDIDGVIDDLSRIIDDCMRRRSKLGYFAALYRTVTIQVRDDIARGNVFDDGELVEQLDVTFANRYLAAYDAFERAAPCSRCWQTAFDAAESRRPIIVQHLLLGINAHINLDLGMAAAEVGRGRDISPMKRDFDRINRVLADLVTEVMDDVSRLSPWLALLDRVGGRTERATINFSIDVARAQAWEFAVGLANASDRDALVDERDAITADLGRLIRHPGWLVSAANLMIRLREVRDVQRVIEELAD